MAVEKTTSVSGLTGIIPPSIGNAFHPVHTDNIFSGDGEKVSLNKDFLDSNTMSINVNGKEIDIQRLPDVTSNQTAYNEMMKKVDAYDSHLPEGEKGTKVDFIYDKNIPADAVDGTDKAKFKYKSVA